VNPLSTFRVVGVGVRATGERDAALPAPDEQRLQLLRRRLGPEALLQRGGLLGAEGAEFANVLREAAVDEQ
jgi:predicted nucleic acid-binding Zn ribbon protein